MAAIGLTATPATTVKVALTRIMNQRPNLVVSGINRGTNLGLAAYISGTVGAAREAVMQGIPAIASSLAFQAARDVDSYRAAAEATVRVATIVKTQGIPPGILLNVNVPAGTMQTFKGIRLTTQGTAVGGDERFETRTHPTTGRTYYWNVFIEGGMDVEGTDTWAVQNGYVAVTPLKVGEFDQRAFDALKGVIK
jgi:5'-nucleotidase